MEATPSGYSGTSLVKKLGIKPGSRILPINAPGNYAVLLGPLPEGAQFETRPGERIDIAQLFATRKQDLVKALTMLRKKLRPDASVWVSWPKKSAKIPTEVTEHTIREVALPLGFVDIKVCAVNEVWSGLKLVVRKELR